MTVFECDDYKSALRQTMSGLREQFGSRFTFERMAEACGVQKTYLSKVLNSESHLNPDQLYSAGEYLKLKPDEIDFLLLLRDLQTTYNPKRKIILDGKILKIQKAGLKTESKIQVQTEDSLKKFQWEYYSDVDLQLTYLFMTLPAYAKAPSKICDRIGINEGRLQSILLKLQSWGLIEFKNGVYHAKDPKMHLPEDSPIFLAFSILHRVKAIEKIRKTKPEKTDDYFFSATFSADSKMQIRLKRKILDLIKQAQAESMNAKYEEVYQFNIDFFRW